MHDFDACTFLRPVEYQPVPQVFAGEGGGTKRIVAGVGLLGAASSTVETRISHGLAYTHSRPTLPIQTVEEL